LHRRWRLRFGTCLIADARVRGQERSRLAALLDGLAGGGGSGGGAGGRPGGDRQELHAGAAGGQRARARVLGGGGAGAGARRPRPFGVFAGALEVLSGDRDLAAVWRRLGADTQTAVGAVAPALGDEQAQTGVAAYRVRRAMRLLLGALAARRPLLLALDDLHRADQESLSLLVYLLDHLPAAPVLVAVSYRVPGTAMSAARAALGTGSAETIELRSLSRGDARRLLPAKFDEQAVARLRAQSSGIHLGELLAGDRRRAASRQKRAVMVQRRIAMPISLRPSAKQRTNQAGCLQHHSQSACPPLLGVGGPVVSWPASGSWR